jgi:hypothetical protein
MPTRKFLINVHGFVLARSMAVLMTMPSWCSSRVHLM